MSYKTKIYPYEEVYQKTLDYFKGDEVATNVWITKYCLKDLTDNGDAIYYESNPDDMFHRLAKETYRAGLKYKNPMTEDEIYNLIKEFKYILFQGRPMAGIGSEMPVSISNCFVVGKPGQDSYGTIAYIDQAIMQISKRGGGVGTDLSDYRPSGAKTNNAALSSSGPVDICANRFSNTIREVGQSGRRGALLMSMDITHPEAEKFIDAKMEEGKITGANISVKIYDKWMKEALGDGYEKDPEKYRLWKKIVHNATKRAEPGVLFWDRILEESVADCYEKYGFKTLTTNPCFPKSEYILTKNGYVKFGDLFEKQCKNEVYTDNRVSYIETNTTETPDQWHIDENASGTSLRLGSEVFETKKNAEICELVFKNGSKLRCTPDHHIATINRGMVEAQYLTTDDEILVGTNSFNGSIANRMPAERMEILAFICGLIMGDGTYRLSGKNEIADFIFTGDDAERMKNIVLSLIDKVYNENDAYSKFQKYRLIINEDNKLSVYSPYIAKVLNDHGYNNSTKHVVPEFILNNACTDIGKFFLSGLMYCKGNPYATLDNRIVIELNLNKVDLLRQVQMIFNANGFTSTIEYNKKKYKLVISDLQTKDYQYVIGFAGDQNRENKFTIFSNPYKVKNTTNLVSYTLLEEHEDVYCIKEPVTRSIIVNGITTRRCGEITLSNLDSCRLMALNLYSYVKKPFTSEAYFDYNLFASHARKIVKIMDNMIDLEIEQIERIINKVENDPEDDEVKAIELNLWKKVKEVAILGRRSGIGITAEGDMLAAMGYKYGTPTATAFAAHIQQLLALNVYIGSCDLVQIDGRPAFGCYDYELEKNNPFINRLADKDSTVYGKDIILPYIEEYIEKYKKGRRNIALLTIAPTGSLSCATQTTSGVEPLFMAKYTRRRKIDKDSGITPDFIDKTGDYFINFNILHNKFIVWYSVYKGITFEEAKKELEVMKDHDFDMIYKNSPYYGATAMDCKWQEKVKMQGDIQKYVDHSISTTINLPRGTSEDIVDELYQTAWRSGCKGCTIYVDGSLDGVLINNETEKKKNCNCNDFLEKDAPKRPKSLPCKIVRFTNNKEKWIAAVGLFEGRPYEIFTGLLDKMNIPNGIEDATIVRNKVETQVLNYETGEYETKMVSRYDLVYTSENETKSVEGLSTVFNKEYWNYGKLVSGLLRHGMPIQYVIKVISSLDFKDDGINSWKNGVIRALKKFTKDGETDEICPECGDKLWRESGCVVCKSCGWSKCG